MKRFIYISFIPFMLQGIPEQMGIVTLAFVIAKIPIKWSRIFFVGAGLALIAYIIRLFPIPFGIHTVTVVLILFFILTRLGVDFSLSLIACLGSILAVMIFEIACLSLLMSAFEVSPETLMTDPVIRTFLTTPQILLLFFSAFLMKLYLKKKVTK